MSLVSFLDQSSRAVLEAVPSSASLVELCRQVGGLFPTDVRDLVASLALDPISAEALTSYEVWGGELEVWSSILPLPHPLDYEWRFSTRGAYEICETLDRFASRAGLGLFAGPGLAEHLQDSTWAADAVLFEIREAPCRAISGLGIATECGDVLQMVSSYERRLGAVVADPPWYPAVTDRFIVAAASSLAPGGVMLLVAPGLNTRPGLGRERERITALASRHGLTHAETQVSAVEYEAPPFELAALRASGMPRFDPYWRRGDLMVFVRGESRTSSMETDVEQPSSDWQEVCVGPIRVRVRRGANSFSGTLESIVDGNVFPSVSSRHQLRDLPNVWTTSNMVFGTCDPDGLIDSLISRESVAQVDESDASRVVQADLDALRGLGLC